MREVSQLNLASYLCWNMHVGKQPCWLSRGQQVLHQSWISRNIYHVCLHQVWIKLPTLALKPRGCHQKSKTGVSVAPQKGLKFYRHCFLFFVVVVHFMPPHNIVTVGKYRHGTLWLSVPHPWEPPDPSQHIHFIRAFLLRMMVDLSCSLSVNDIDRQLTITIFVPDRASEMACFFLVAWDFGVVTCAKLVVKFSCFANPEKWNGRSRWPSS